MAVKAELEEFLRARVYRHPWVLAMAEEGMRAVRGLFERLTARPEDLPARHRERLVSEELPRVVGDYLAGMTDRFAAGEFQRLCPGRRSVS
jgi:dGTPase